MMGSAEIAVETRKFFIRLNEGRRHHAKTATGGSVELLIRSPSIEDAELASEIVGELDFPRLGASAKDARRKLVRLACVSCIDGVTDENVMAFLDEIDPSSSVVLKCLRLLGVDEADAERVGMVAAP